MSDNLGLEVVWRNHGVLLVSNGGQPFRYGWRNSHLRWVLRCTEVAGHQVDRLRVAVVLISVSEMPPHGPYWGIGNTASSFGTLHSIGRRIRKRRSETIYRECAQTWTDLQTKKARSWKITATASQRRRLTFTCCTRPWRKELGISDYGNTNVPHPKLMATNFSDAESVQRMTSLSGGISRTAISTRSRKACPMGLILVRGRDMGK